MHIAIIMDGNRRWAKAHAFQTLLGHTKGSEVMENTIEWADETGVEIATFWALAKKNIEERSKEELTYLYKLLDEKINSLLPKLQSKNMVFDTIGNLSMLPKAIEEKLEKAKKDSEKNTGMRVVIALGYGGQDEIVRGVRRCITEGIDPETLNEKSFAKYLDSGHLPAPELIIRTGGDIRHSGFYLFAAEYSEYYFTNTLWPDFSREEFDRALGSLKNAKRNFGK